MNKDTAGTTRSTVIYLRARGADGSAVMRRDEGALRQQLSNAGIDHTDAIVLSVIGSGQRQLAFRRLIDLVESDRVGVLAMISLSTLARGLRRFSILHRLIEHNASLVLEDGVIRPEMIAQVEMEQEMFEGMLARRIRRGRARNCAAT